MFDEKKKQIEYGLLLVVSFLLFLGLMKLFTGKGCLDPNLYNTYALQADSWRQGRLDLGQDYPWLELAIFKGKYYCSFPPFPSYVLFPLTFFFGSNTPDGVVLLLFDLLAVTGLYFTALKLGLDEKTAVLGALFVTIGSNMVFILFDPSVWFLAQSMCFALSVLSIYFAVCGSGGASLFFWACAVGCRPMQILYLPVLLMILYKKEKEKEPETDGMHLIMRRWYWIIPAAVVGGSYMLLNGLRFGDVLEFGHNYLPEFQTLHKQFGVVYMKENFRQLMRLPEFVDGKMAVNYFGNLNFMIASPMILFTLLLFVYTCFFPKKKQFFITASMLLLSACYLAITIMHATMGAWHFGNRYANDILPWIYLGMCGMLSEHPRLSKWQLPFFVFGVCLNAVGTVIVYNGL